eukprot:22331-Amphidinium_carterae.1
MQSVDTLPTITESRPSTRRTVDDRLDEPFTELDANPVTEPILPASAPAQREILPDKVAEPEAKASELEENEPDKEGAAVYSKDTELIVVVERLGGEKLGMVAFTNSGDEYIR